MTNLISGASHTVNNIKIMASMFLIMLLAATAIVPASAMVIVARVNDTVSLSCKNNKTIWFYKSTPESESPITIYDGYRKGYVEVKFADRFEVEERYSGDTLVMNNIEQSDTGVYICSVLKNTSVDFTYDESKTAVFTVDVYRKSFIFAHLGGNISMYCPAGDASWKHKTESTQPGTPIATNGNHVVASHTDRISVYIVPDGGQLLTITDLHRSDLGSYECINFHTLVEVVVVDLLRNTTPFNSGSPNSAQSSITNDVLIAPVLIATIVGSVQRMQSSYC